MLGHTQFVYVPVGASRQSVLEVMPQLKDPWAPVVKYQQGGKATCMFSSIALALHSSGDSQLQQLANNIHWRSPQHVGVSPSLKLLKEMVQADVRWLQHK